MEWEQAVLPVNAVFTGFRFFPLTVRAAQAFGEPFGDRSVLRSGFWDDELECGRFGRIGPGAGAAT